VLIGQWLRFTSDDIRGSLPRPAFNAIVALGVVCAYALFLFARSAVGDPLDLFGTVIVQNAATVFLVPWILSRRSTRGQSRLFAFGTLIGPASLGLLQAAYLSPSFQTWQFFFLMGVTTALAVVYWLLFEHFRRAEVAASRHDVPVHPSRSLVPDPAF
jgi:hypothetical protein